MAWLPVETVIRDRQQEENDEVGLEQLRRFDHSFGLTADFYQSSETTCPYLDGQVRQDIFTNEQGLKPLQIQALLDFGFRRSGTIVYRPACPQCLACQPTRILVDEFSTESVSTALFKTKSRSHVDLVQSL